MALYTGFYYETFGPESATKSVILSYADSCRKNHNDTIIKDEGRLL